MKLRHLFLSWLVVPLLAGCIIEPASYLIDGGDHSLALVRSKDYFWSTGWEVDLIVARYPDCQRRHPLKSASDKKFRVDLYLVQPGIFILNQNKRWYVAETRECRLQQFDEAPPVPGELQGTFRVKNGVFGFVPASDAAGKTKAATE